MREVTAEFARKSFLLYKQNYTMKQQYDDTTLQGILDQYEGMGQIEKSKLFPSGFKNSNYLHFNIFPI